MSTKQMKNYNSSYGIFFLIAILLLILIQAQKSLAEDMLKITNPGFEDLSTDGTIPGWTQTHGTGGISISKEQRYDGLNSLKITDESDSSPFGIASYKLGVNAGEKYEVKAMTYISSGGAMIYLRFYDSAEKCIASFNTIKYSPIGEWFKISVVGVAPAAATRAAILLYSGKDGKGISYYDSIEINKSLDK